MKTTKLLPVGLFCLLSIFSFTSCEKYMTDEGERKDPQPQEDIHTKALSFDIPSTSNPTLHSDWENVEVIYLNNGQSVDAPWVYKDGNSMNIPDDYRMDIKKEDGWKLLSHTMLAQGSAEPNYILFYNKYRGQIKGFYFHTTSTSNNSFVWLLESELGPSSIIPSNTRIQTPLNSTSQYITTSNIVKNSHASFGQLNQGWNAFSYELMYASTNSEPKVKFTGYNTQNSNLELNGNFSGEVIIPKIVQSNPLSGASSILSAASGVISIIPTATTISKALSIASSVLGTAGAYFGKSETVNARASCNGKINLTGSMIQNLGGIIPSINNIDLRKINNNEPLGLWNLKRNPKYTYGKYQVLSKVASPADVFEGYMEYTLDDLKSLIEINPQVIPSIKNYTILSYQLFCEVVLNHPFSESYTAAANKCLYINYFKIKTYGAIYDLHNPSNENQIFVYPYCKVEDDIYMNITVEFEYNDGSKYISSRNYKTEMTQVDNYDYISYLKSLGFRITYVGMEL